MLGLREEKARILIQVVAVESFLSSRKLFVAREYFCSEDSLDEEGDFFSNLTRLRR